MLDETLRLSIAAIALVVLAAFGCVTPAFGQTGNPEDAPVQLDRLALTPVLRLSNVGWDDNVFHMSEIAGPIGDFTATFSPAVEAWLRLTRARLTGRSEVDFIYFKELTQIRSIDTNNAGQIDLLLYRLTPYIGGTWDNTRHQRNFEIDAPARRLDSSWTAGVDARISKKTTIGVTTRRTRVDYEEETRSLGSDLANLNSKSTSYGGRLRYELTPLTTVGLDAGQYETDFVTVPERNSKGSRITSVFEFKPKALVSGRAEIGIVSRRFVDGKVPEFRGLASRVELGYTLLGRTRFDVTVQRDLSPSYRVDQRDYLQAGVQLLVTHRIADAWDVRATLGRFTLTYGLVESPGTGSLSDFLDEQILIYGSEVGYRIGHTRVGIEVARQSRTADFSRARDYERTRIASSFTYAF